MNKESTSSIPRSTRFWTRKSLYEGAVHLCACACARFQNSHRCNKGNEQRNNKLGPRVYAVLNEKVTIGAVHLCECTGNYSQRSSVTRAPQWHFSIFVSKISVDVNQMFPLPYSCSSWKHLIDVHLNFSFKCQKMSSRGKCYWLLL